MGCHHFAECPVCDAPEPCAHCEDGWSPEGYCTCGMAPTTGLVIVDVWAETVYAELWKGGRKISRVLFCAPDNADTVTQCQHLALAYLLRMGVRSYRVTEDLEAVA
ncbi:hypothetical protein [Microcystis phage Mae-JY09]